MNRWLKWLGAALLLAPVALHVVVFVLPGTSGYVVASGSMEPALPSGSFVVVTESDEYEVDDVVTYERGEAVVTHRLVDHHSGGFVTAGDANDETDDAVVPPSAIRGSVAFHLPLYGRVLSFVDSLPGYLLLVVCPSVLLIGQELSVLRRRLG